MSYISESFKNRIKKLAGILTEEGIIPAQTLSKQAYSQSNDSQQTNFYKNLHPKQAIEKAAIDYNLAVKQNNTGQADKIVGNLKSYLESQNYNWKQDPRALELLSDFLNNENVNSIKESNELATILQKMSMQLFDGVYIHYPEEKLLYKITKTSGEGPYAETYGMVYIGDEHRVAEWQKNRYDMAKDIYNKKAFLPSKEESNALVLLYRPSKIK